MINKPINFALGIFCGFCFLIAYKQGSNLSMYVSAIATAISLTVGLSGRD